jgi:Ca2+-binding RTX toxin-like protein
MSHRTVYRLVFFGFVLLVFASAVTAVAASNTVPSSRLADDRSAIDANALKPPECDALDLTSIVICPATGGTCDGTNASELILGSRFADTIRGRQGDDCILGGGGAATTAQTSA